MPDQKLRPQENSNHIPCQDIFAPDVDGQWSMGSEVEIYSTESNLGVSIIISSHLSHLWMSAKYNLCWHVLTTIEVSDLWMDFLHIPYSMKTRLE
jgi:hypothetical protein